MNVVYSSIIRYMYAWMAVYRSAPATPHLACWPPSILFQCNQPLVWGGVLMDHSCIMHRGASELLSCMLYAGMVDIYSMAVFIFIFIYYHYHCALLIPALTLLLSHRLSPRIRTACDAALLRSFFFCKLRDRRPAGRHAQECNDDDDDPVSYSYFYSLSIYVALLSTLILVV